jgi:hypothetical protein
MKPFIAHYLLWKLLAMLCLALGFVATSAWIVGFWGVSLGPGIGWVGWIGMVFFGLCALAIAKRVFERDEQLRICDHGIRFKSWSNDTVPWSEIEYISTWSTHGQSSILLHLKDRSLFPSTKILGKLTDLNRAMTGGDIPIQLTGTNKSFEEALAAIENFRSRASIGLVDGVQDETDPHQTT